MLSGFELYPRWVPLTIKSDPFRALELTIIPTLPTKRSYVGTVTTKH